MDIQAKQTLKNIKSRYDVTVTEISQKPIGHFFGYYSRVITQAEALELFGISIPFVARLESPCPRVVEHKAIVRSILNLISKGC